MKKSLKRLSWFSVVLVVAVALAPSEEERAAAHKQEIEQLKKDLDEIQALNVDDRLDAYEKLSAYYPGDEIYKKMLEQYKRMDAAAGICRIESRKQDRSSLVNPGTYQADESTRLNKWASEKEFITGSAFSGKNSFGVEVGFVSRYKCTLTADGVRIKKLLLKREVF